MYQVAALVRTLDEADRPGAAFDHETMLKQADALIMAAIAALDGRSEAAMVERLLAVRNNLRSRRGAGDRTGEVDAVKTAALDAVNDYFRERLYAVPSIAAYLEELAARA
jgi:hypothetical protein